MATQLFLSTDSTGFERASCSRGRADTLLAGGTVTAWQSLSMATTRYATAVNRTANTVAGPTSGVEIAATGTIYYEWLSDPLAADITISGTITFNIWAAESNMSANVAANCMIERIDSTGAIVSTIIKTARTTEVAVTTRAVNNFTGTPTSTNMLKGDRIRVRLFGDDAGTMASTYTFNFGWGGPTAAVDGDTYVTFTENLTFTPPSTPAGTTFYLTDTAGPEVGANLEKLLSLSRGGSAIQAVVQEVNGPLLGGVQWTDSLGGTAIDWYTNPLNAFTLADIAQGYISAWTGGGLTRGTSRCEIAVCNADGSGAVVWGASTKQDKTAGSAGFLSSIEAQQTVPVWGDDLAVTDGQIIRLRVYVSDAGDVMVDGSGHPGLYYNGPTLGASGDSYIIFGQTITEKAGVPRHPAINHSNPALL